MDKATREAVATAGTALLADGMAAGIRDLSIETLLSTSVKLQTVRDAIAAELVRRNYHAPVN